MTVYARSSQRVIMGTKYALARRLPSKGKVFAKLGDEVKPETVVAEGKVSAGFRVFRLGELLGVPPNKAKQYLRRTVGSRIYQGDVIAEAPKLFGLRHQQFVSPIDGVLQNFQADTGHLMVQFAPLTFRLPAGIKGKVSQVLPEEGVFVQSEVNILHGAFMVGSTREGALRLIAPPDQPIAPSSIDAKLRGYIIGGGSLVGKDVISRCIAVGVKGIVCGGIAAQDLLQISGEINSKEDVGISILITSGLGATTMDEQVYQLLQQHQEKQVFLVSEEKILLASSSEGAVSPGKSAQAAITTLKPGMSVRIISRSYRGEVATIKEIIPDYPLVASYGTATHCLLQRTNNDTIVVPATNLEVITYATATQA